MLTFRIAALAALFALQGCLLDGPGEQCLNSFRSDLKDPESGKVISFEDPELVYTATNSYGARIKGKALCKQENGKWQRDHISETSKIMKRTIETLHASNICMEGGKSSAECAGESLALKHIRPGVGVDIDALNTESKEALGF